MDFISKLENSIVNILIQDKHTDIEREKIIFGVKIILNDLWKFMIVYLIALYLDCFFATNRNAYSIFCAKAGLFWIPFSKQSHVFNC